MNSTETKVFPVEYAFLTLLNKVIFFDDLLCNLLRPEPSFPNLTIQPVMSWWVLNPSPQGDTMAQAGKLYLMKMRSFIIAYALVLAIVLFAERRPAPAQHGQYSHIVDLTNQQADGIIHGHERVSQTRIIAPDSLIPGTWTAGQIPPERLIAPLVVMDLNVAPPAQISLDDIATWETTHGAVPQGAVVAIRPHGGTRQSQPAFPITNQAAQFLMDARYTIGFIVDTPADFTTNRPLAEQIALHGNYVVEDAAPIATLPASGALIMVAPSVVVQSTVAPSAGIKLHAAPVRVLAMVR